MPPCGVTCARGHRTRLLVFLGARAAGGDRQPRLTAAISPPARESVAEPPARERLAERGRRLRITVVSAAFLRGVSAAALGARVALQSLLILPLPAARGSAFYYLPSPSSKSLDDLMVSSAGSGGNMTWHAGCRAQQRFLESPVCTPDGNGNEEEARARARVSSSPARLPSASMRSSAAIIRRVMTTRQPPGCPAARVRRRRGAAIQRREHRRVDGDGPLRGGGSLRRRVRRAPARVTRDVSAESEWSRSDAIANASRASARTNNTVRCVVYTF